MCNVASCWSYLNYLNHIRNKIVFKNFQSFLLYEDNPDCILVWRNYIKILVKKSHTSSFRTWEIRVSQNSAYEFPKHVRCYALSIGKQDQTAQHCLTLKLEEYVPPKCRYIYHSRRHNVAEYLNIIYIC